MHLKRWLTSIILLPFVIFLIYKGGISFFILISIVSLIALCEYFRIVFNTRGSTISGIILLSALLSGELILWAAYKNSIELILVITAFNLIFSGSFSLTQFKSDPVILENIFKQIQGIIYIPISLCLILLIRNSSNGSLWIFFLISVIFAGDTGAYYVGSYWGKHKLCPGVSPGKTVEGSIGGLAANVVIGILFKLFFLSVSSWGISILFFILLGIAGQAGDLFESELKRSSHIKDSGSILPGHGGMLDRIDALLFAVPVAYFFKEFLF